MTAPSSVDAAQAPPSQRAGWLADIKAKCLGVYRVAKGYPCAIVAPLVVLALILGLGIFGVHRVSESVVNGAKARASALAMNVASVIERTATATTSPAMVLGAVARDKPRYEELLSIFAAVAPSLLIQAPPATLVSLELAPAGVVRALHPAGQAGMGLDLLNVSLPGQPPGPPAALLHAISAGGTALGGPFQLADGGRGVSVTVPVWVAGVGPGERFGQPDTINPLCGAACNYNASARSKLWGFIRCIVNVDAVVGSSDLHLLEMRGYRYNLEAALLPAAPAAAGEGARSISSSRLPVREPVEARITLQNVYWTLGISPHSGWGPVWYGGLVAAVVVLGVTTAALLFVVLISRRRHQLLLEALLPKELIHDLRAENVAELGQQNILSAETPADLMLSLLAVLLEGGSPDLRDVVFLRTALLRNMDLYRPMDLRGQIKGANLDTDVMAALMRQLGAGVAADDGGRASLIRSGGQLFDSVDLTAIGLGLGDGGGGGGHPGGGGGGGGGPGNGSSLLSSTQNLHNSMSCDTLAGALAFLLAPPGTGGAADADAAAALPTRLTCPASLDALEDDVLGLGAMLAPVAGSRGTAPHSRLVGSGSSVTAAPCDRDGGGEGGGGMGTPTGAGGGGGGVLGGSAASGAGAAGTPTAAGTGGGSKRRSLLREGGGSLRLGSLGLLGGKGRAHMGSHADLSSLDTGGAAGGPAGGVGGSHHGSSAYGSSVHSGLFGSVHNPHLQHLHSHHLAGATGAASSSSLKPPAVAAAATNHQMMMPPRLGSLGAVDSATERTATSASSNTVAGGGADSDPVSCGGGGAGGGGGSLRGVGSICVGATERSSVRGLSNSGSREHPLRLASVGLGVNPGVVMSSPFVDAGGGGGGGGGAVAGVRSRVAAALGLTTVALSGGAAAVAAPKVALPLMPSPPPPPPPPVIEDVEKLLSCADGWQFDTWALQEATQGHALSTLGFYLMQREGLVEHFRIKPVTLARLLRSLEAGYLDNPYHNACHAADVLQTLHVLLHGAQLQAHYVDKLGLLAAYFAAIVHDFAHPGLTNDFLIATAHPLAIRYNDRSPLENHHAASAFALLAERRDLDVLGGLSTAEKGSFRKQVIEMVTATDMKQHFAILSHFNTVHRLASYTQGAAHVRPRGPSGDDPGGAAPGYRASTEAAPRPLDESERLLTLQVALKVADIGHLGEELGVHTRWLRVLEDEFFNQGDREQALGLPISPLFDRSKQGVSKSQVGFYDFVALPLAHAMSSAFPGAAPIMHSFLNNYNHWKVIDSKAADAARAPTPTSPTASAAATITTQPTAAAPTAGSPTAAVGLSLATDLPASPAAATESAGKLPSLNDKSS